MNKKKAKLIFKHNSFEIVEDGDYVLCAVSGKEIMLKNLKGFFGYIEILSIVNFFKSNQI